jgi:beta-lactam-binding protein with PASTA domain/tRNA A-37 threonylcarbamoyl transferase component Bud32
MEEPRRLGGRYELGSVLGRGGMAEVYLAHDIRLGRTVAVKTLRTDMARDPSFQARFRREAQSAASLNHPSIVAVYDTGEDYIDGISIPYIVMEYVDGSTLRELLHTGRRLLPERAMEMCIGILQALEYSHRNGIVHRDIKPANVMLTRNGTVKVMDFGIARAMGDQGMTMTQTAAVIGTAQYLSPEQAKGEQVDARSDLYSTGCLLYELLALRPPFIGDSPVAVAYQHVREEPQPPSVFDPELRPEYDAIVLKALAKDRDYRYQSADEMRADIERALDGLPVAAAQTMALGSVGYGEGYGSDPYAQTNVMPSQGQAAGATSVLPPVSGGYDAGGDGYDDGYGGGRRAARGGGQKRGRASWILLALAAVLVLVGSFYVARAMFNGSTNNSLSPMPSLIGESFSAAQSQIQQAYGDKVTLVKGTDVSCDASIASNGNICTQDPQPNAAVSNGQKITVHVSSGPPKIQVPYVIGQSLDQASAALEAKGFVLGNTQYQQTSSAAANTVIAENPNAGTAQSKGAAITLTVAQPPTSATVPNLYGQTLQAAQQALQQAGLKANPVPETQATTLQQGQVDRQDTAANTQVATGTTITFYYVDQNTPTGPPSASSSPSPTDSGNTVFGNVFGTTQGNNGRGNGG